MSQKTPRAIRLLPLPTYAIHMETQDSNYLFHNCSGQLWNQILWNKHSQHIINSLQQKYITTVDWTSKNFLGLDIDWNYQKRHVTISIPNYINQILHKFQHPLNLKPTNSPPKYNAPTYGAKMQYSNPIGAIKLIPPSDITHVQQVIGTLMHYAMALENTIIDPMGDLTSAQSKIT